ncbi:MAG: hypothetical protein N3E44_03265 [Candidatus Bathyarchaeota archaeon]|nr:hypothetical protein [Candidatus Bathyarchaeota archaeon]
MRIHVVLDLYIFKVKTFFGALRASKASIALLLLYTLSFLLGLFSFSTPISDAIRKGVTDIDSYIELLSSVASLLMVFAVSLALRGYTVFEYEQNLIFTSPIKPREFLIADIFSNLTSLLIFANPIVIFYVMIVHSLKLSTLSALLMLSSSILFIFTLLLLKTSLSMIKSLYGGNQVNTLILAIVVILVLPAAGFIADLPLEYNSLPYPSTFLARILVKSVYSVDRLTLDFAGLSSYFLLSVLLFLSISTKNLFPTTTCIPFVSPFDTSMRMQTLQMERNIKMFSRIGMLPTLNLGSKSLLTFLMKKEVIRVIREGSLFTIIFFYLIASFIVVATSISSSQTTQSLPYTYLVTFFVGVYSLTIPLMLVSNWRFSDIGSLWIPLTSGMDLRIMVNALLYSFISISSVIPAAVISILSLIYSINPMIPLTLAVSTSMIGCPVNLYIMVGFLGMKSSGTPSILIGLASMLLSVLLLTPTYILIFLGLHLSFGDVTSWLLTVTILAYSTLIMKLFSREIKRSISRIEL